MLTYADVCRRGATGESVHTIEEEEEEEEGEGEGEG
jgi:hypothetical protein